MDISVHGGQFGGGGNVINAGKTVMAQYVESIKKGDLVGTYVKGNEIPMGIALDIIPIFSYSGDGKIFVTLHSTTGIISIYRVEGGVYTLVDNTDTPFSGRSDIAVNFDGSVFSIVGDVYGSAVFRLVDGVYKRMPLDVAPAGSSWGVAMDELGNFVFIAHGGAPYLSIYTWVGSSYVKVPNRPDIPTGICISIAYKEPFLYVFMNSGQVYAYSVDVGGMLTRMPGMSMLPSGAKYAAKVSTNGKYLAALTRDGTQTYPLIIDLSEGAITGTRIHSAAADSTSRGIDFISESSVAFANSSGAIQVLEANTANPLALVAFNPRVGIPNRGSWIATIRNKGITAFGLSIKTYDMGKAAESVSGEISSLRFYLTSKSPTGVGFAEQGGTIGQTKKIKEIWGA
ncbi:Uncharacterised protein [Lysinibacillus sphaericus]|nr:Uncharacterised protein [Lysinibacillus sphaericus]